MVNWLDNPGSLSWANRKKLIKQILQLETNITLGREFLLSLTSLANSWELNCRALSQESNDNKLTAKHILGLRPLLKSSEDFKNALEKICNSHIPTSQHRERNLPKP
jgi:hypothetical protein